MSQLLRRLSPITLFLFSLNGIIGSGWLFAPLYAAQIAGPAAIVSWLLGGIAVLLVALTFAELSTMFPVTGGTAHLPQLSHGIIVGFIMGWLAWISSLMLTPIEVQAVLQYTAIFFPGLIYKVQGVPHLTVLGMGYASLLMLLLSILNIISYQGLLRFNFILCFLKFFVILATIIALFKLRFYPSNFNGVFTALHSPADWQAIFSALSSGGIILAFNGFKSGVELAGETKNLKVAIPLSTVGTVAACIILYVSLQICFIGAIDPTYLKNGWQQLAFAGDLGPFVGLAAGLGLIWLLKLLYINAVVSPLGAGLIYVTASARILYAMSKMRLMPTFLSKLNKQRFPIWAIAINFVIGMLAFLPLPGWQAMVNFLISVIVITYAMGPLTLMSLRYALPNKHRPFYLPAAPFICSVAFYFCNLFNYWTGWQTISKLAVLLALGMFCFAFAYWRGAMVLAKQDIKAAAWILGYFSGLTLISYLGAFGGIHYITFGWDFLIIGIFSVVIFQLGIYCRSDVNQESKLTIIPEKVYAYD